MTSSGAPVVRITGMVRQIIERNIEGRTDRNTGLITPPRTAYDLIVDTGMMGDTDSPGGFATVTARADEAGHIASIVEARVGERVVCYARSYVSTITIRQPRRDNDGVVIPGTGRWGNEVGFSLVQPVLTGETPGKGPYPPAKPTAVPSGT